MARGVVTENHKASEGRGIWNANDLELYNRAALLEAKIRLGGISGIAPDADGGNVDILGSTYIQLVKDMGLNTLTIKALNLIGSHTTVADIRALPTNDLVSGRSMRAVVGAAPSLYVWNAATAIAFTAVEATDVFSTVADHGLFTGDAVTLYGAALPGNFLTATTYYVIRLTATTFRLATTQQEALNGTARNVTVDGSGSINYADDSLYTLVPNGNPQNGRWYAMASNHRVPTIVGGARLGTGGTVKLLEGSTNDAGTIEFTVGTSPPAGGSLLDYFTVTATSPFRRAKPIVQLTGANGLASDDSWGWIVRRDTLTSSSWTMAGNFLSGAGSTHQVNYTVMGG